MEPAHSLSLLDGDLLGFDSLPGFSASQDLMDPGHGLFDVLGDAEMLVGASGPRMDDLSSAALRTARVDEPSVFIKPEEAAAQDISEDDENDEDENDVVGARPSTSFSTHATTDMAQDMPAPVSKPVKRRRRVRTGRQQELNRLAQQRYRERKKQKAANLASAVDELSKQLDEKAVLELQHSQLQAAHGQLQRTAAHQQQELAAAKTTIAQQQQTIQQQEATIRQQEAVISRLSGQGTQGDDAATQPDAAAQPAGADFSAQLATALRAVLSGLPVQDAQDVQQALSQLPDSVLQRIQSCCREVSAHLHKAELKAQSHAIQVSCC